MHVKRNFLLEQRKCSYESAVETPDLGSGPTSDIFLHICVRLYFSQLESNEQSSCVFMRKLAHLRYVISCYVKLFIYDGAASKIQLLEYSSLSILFSVSFLKTVLLIQKGLKVMM